MMVSLESSSIFGFLFVCLFICLFKRFYFFIWQRDTAREGNISRGEWKREAGSPPSREPNVELDPRILRPWPWRKADASPSEPPRCPKSSNFVVLCSTTCGSGLMEAPSPCSLSSHILPQIHFCIHPIFQEVAVFLFTEFLLFLSSLSSWGLGVQNGLIAI